MAKIYVKGVWVNEELADAEKYLVKDDAGLPVYENADISLATEVIVAGTPLSAARMNNIEEGIDAIDDRVDALDLATLPDVDITGVVDGNALVYDGIALKWVPGEGGGGGSGLTYLHQGRLSLESGVPISITDQVDKINLYYVPYNGNLIDIYNGADWVRHTFTEKSLALGALTASKPHDIFIYDNAGALTLQAVEWTNATTRATALTTQDGVLVLTGATNKRYLGTIYIDAGQKCQDKPGERHVYNLYNKAPRKLLAIDTTATWTYTIATWRAANNNTTNGVGRFSFVCGMPYDNIDIFRLALVANSNVGVIIAAGIGIDKTNDTDCIIKNTNNTHVANHVQPIISRLVSSPGIGFHYAQAVEYSTATGTTTWVGAGVNRQAGMEAIMMM